MNGVYFWLILAAIYTAPNLRPQWRAIFSVVFVALAAIFFILQVMR